MTSLTPTEVNAVLQAGGPGATVFLVGAAGCGMSGLGHLFLDLGYMVAGSDLVANEATRQLHARGAEISRAHSGDRVRALSPVLVVCSSAVPSANPEILAAQERQIPLARRGVVLAALIRRQRGICVAGMHGKTTTTALAAFALGQLEARPSYAIGALVPQLCPHARFSRMGELEHSDSPSYFVAEADESDGTLCDFQPEYAVILNLDEEHLDHFSSLDSLCGEFERFAKQTSGKVVYCADDPYLAKLFAEIPNGVSFGFDALADYRIRLKRVGSGHSPARASTGTLLEVCHRGELLGDFSVSLLGRHNASNAAAVIALLHQLGFGASEIARAIRSFRGAARRQQELYRDEDFRVYDDYGHHPTEIRATLRALRDLAPQRLLVAFQPHRYSRTQHLLRQFASCFEGADRLWLADIYAASEQPQPGVSSAVLAEAIRSHGQAVEYVPELSRLGARVREEMEPGDFVLFIGAGDITEVAQEFATQLRHEKSRRRESLCVELSRRLTAASVVRRDELLGKRTTLRVGGPADWYVEPATEGDLSAVLHFCAEHDLPFLLLGRGSNLLVQDCGVRGVVISLARPEFSRVEIRGDELHCGAGARLKTVAVEAKRNGLSGLEFLEGIPGSVGGALRMNAGAMGSSMFEIVASVRLMDFNGQIQERRVEEIKVNYRHCPLFRNHVALGAVLKGRPETKELIAARMNACSRKRWNSQPAAPSAGCIFKNPAAIPAGRLIEDLGLKGARVGGAVVSDMHGNFIINDGQATADDVLQLIDMIKGHAQTLRGIELETEVEIVSEVAPCRAVCETVGTVEQVGPVGANS